MEDTLRTLVERFDATGVDRRRDRLAFAIVPPDRLVDAVTWLRDLAGYRHLVLLTAVDRIEEGIFRLLYLLRAPEERADIGLHVDVPREGASMESIHHLWAAARVYQRELREMFGIDFPGSPEVDVSMILEGWDGPPPMRRDFDTRKYSEETFYPREGRETRDPAAHAAVTRYPADEQVKDEIRRVARENRTRGE
ncbi:MAG: NADH-quinone oxidoreductase subunit C [Candidatus Krumholzibacteriota bacterium]|nr:NADH-quinone oxidoreductase subunit C [Candidatus Krumholzibacteriota bacterium]